MRWPYVSPTSESIRPAPAWVKTMRFTVPDFWAAEMIFLVDVMKGE
jgi:hypothetical protein